MTFVSHSLMALFVCCCFLNATPTKKERIPKTTILLLRLVPTTEEQLTYLKSLRKDRKGLKMQFWRRPDKINRHVDVWILKVSVKRFWRMINSKQLTYHVITEDIVTDVGKPYLSMNYMENYDEVYQDIEDITSEIRRLNVTHKDMVTMESIGSSSEGRPIYSVRLRKDATKPRTTVFILCGTHPREWLGIAACLYVMRRIVFDHAYDVDVKSFLNNYDVLMIPLLNPDGYQYSKETIRMWRKSRSRTKNPKCRGVDLNRNFGYRWGGGGSSPDPCNGIYCGEKPFSEKESLTLARYLYGIRRSVTAFLDIHTFGQLWMNPWGFSPSYPRDNVRQVHAMRNVQSSIRQKTRQVYRIGRSSAALYPASGTALDWVYGRLGVVHSYAVELRPKRRRLPLTFNGFEVSRGYITPTGKDLFVGLKALVSFMIDEKKEKD